VIEHRVDVRAEPLGIDRRRARERGDRCVRSYELTGAPGNQFTDGYAVAGHDERLASVEGAHDVAAAVAEFTLGDFASHSGSTVARVLRRLHEDASELHASLTRPRNCPSRTEGGFLHRVRFTVLAQGQEAEDRLREQPRRARRDGRQPLEDANADGAEEEAGRTARAAARAWIGGG
jgi:hypothetical protein